MNQQKNLALAFLNNHGETLEEYDGICGELTDSIIHWLGKESVNILYVERAAANSCLLARCGKQWWYHMVPIIDGFVHDAWHPQYVAAPKRYAAVIFPNQKVRMDIY